jgi:uncharacterized protein
MPITRVCILHGYGGSGVLHWQTWLAKKCQKLGLATIYPKLPSKDAPKLQAWLAALSEEMPKIDESTALVGHSLGCQTMLHLLARKDIKSVGLVILVAPLSISKIKESDLSFLAPFWNGIDAAALSRKAKRVVIFASDNDKWSNIEDARKLAKETHADLRIIASGGHLNASSGQHTFREVLGLISPKATEIE